MTAMSIESIRGMVSPLSKDPMPTPAEVLRRRADDWHGTAERYNEEAERAERRAVDLRAQAVEFEAGAKALEAAADQIPNKERGTRIS